MDKKLYGKYLKAFDLPIDKELTEDDIKQAFRKLAKENHPDRFTNAENKELAKKKFQVFNKYQDYLLTNLIDYNKLIKTDRPFEEKSITELRKELSEKMDYLKKMETSLKDLKRKNKDTKEFIKYAEKDLESPQTKALLQEYVNSVYTARGNGFVDLFKRQEEDVVTTFCMPIGLIGLALTCITYFALFLGSVDF